MLVSCASDVKLHSCPQYELVHVHQPTESGGPIKSASWSRDGSCLATVTQKGSTEVLLARKSEMRLLHDAHKAPSANAVRFQRTEHNNLGIGTICGSIWVYDIVSRTIKKRLPCIPGAITLMDWNSDDSCMAVGCNDANVHLFRNSTMSSFAVPCAKTVSALRFHPTEKSVVACASEEGGLLLWDPDAHKKRFFIDAHKSSIGDITFSAQNHNLLISVGLDRAFQFYDIGSAELAFRGYLVDSLTSVDMHCNGRDVAIGTSSGVIYIYDIRQYSSPLKIFEAHPDRIEIVLYQPPVQDYNRFFMDDIEEEPEFEVLPDLNFRSTSNDSFSLLLGKKTEGDLESSNDGPDCESVPTLMDKPDAGDSQDAVDSWLPCASGHTLKSASERALMTDIGAERAAAATVAELSKRAAGRPKSNQTIRPARRMSSIFLDNIQPNITSEEIRAIIRESVESNGSFPRDDIEKHIKDIVKEQMTELIDSLSKHFLSLQFAISKQFVCQEEHITKILSSLALSHSGNEKVNNAQLVSQIDSLKAENLILKRKLSRLLNHTNNNNNNNKSIL